MWSVREVDRLFELRTSCSPAVSLPLAREWFWLWINVWVWLQNPAIVSVPLAADAEGTAAIMSLESYIGVSFGTLRVLDNPDCSGADCSWQWRAERCSELGWETEWDQGNISGFSRVANTTVLLHANTASTTDSNVECPAWSQLNVIGRAGKYNAAHSKSRLCPVSSTAPVLRETSLQPMLQPTPCKIETSKFNVYRRM